MLTRGLSESEQLLSAFKEALLLVAKSAVPPTRNLLR
jgi:hypothetical protein